MASSRKSPKNSDLLSKVTAVLQIHVQRGDRVVAGLSGGIDSVVLLDVLRRASRKMRFELAALHVNHQINPAAGRWAAFCRGYCMQQHVPLTVIRITVPRAGSLEASAREARYRAFAALPAQFIVLAHNLDDQAETVLLQLLRGAGVKGLSAMPVVREGRGERGGAGNRLTTRTSRLTPSVLRPLLEIPRGDIETYARHRKLQWVEDDSNANPAFDRNFLRHRVMPVIAERYPAYRRTLSRAARNFAEAVQLLDDLAVVDARSATDGLAIADLRRLSASRAKNVLRYFLMLHGVLMPSAARLDEYVRQLHEKLAARAIMELGSHELRRFGDELQIVMKKRSPLRTFRCLWRGEGTLSLPELGGTLVLKKCRGAGINLERLTAQPVTVRVRQGGERLRPHPRRPRRSLKNLLQEARVPPWLRDRLPLLFAGNTLVYVPGIGIEAAFQAATGEPAVAPRWDAG